MPVVLIGYKVFVTGTELEVKVEYPSLRLTIIIAAGGQLNGLIAIKAARAKIAI